LTSEGRRQADINIAEGKRSAAILNAEGEAKAIVAKSEATAEGVRIISQAINQSHGESAVKLRIAEQYVDAFKELGKKNNTMLLPADTSNVGSMVAQALGIYNMIGEKQAAQAAKAQTPQAPRVPNVLDSSEAEN
jgi:regulator of protease activity HflC (stomatin/prohibitin superfamily)